MNIDAPLFAILILALMLACSWMTVRLWHFELPKGRLISIDGLRGFLAASVFIHHSIIWRDYLQSGLWRAPESNLYNQLGQSSVGLFFMITGFLFTRRLLDGDMDWLRLYAGRFMRLTPLYIFALAVMLTLVAWRSDFTLQEPVRQILGQTLGWLTFGALMPPINGVTETVIMLGVTWTLPWEWKFYLSLPLVSLALGVRARRYGIALIWIASILSVLFAPMPRMFLAGGLVAVLVRDQRWLAFAASRRATLLAIACLLTVALLFHGAFRPLPLLFLTLFFAIVAGGNTLFGALAWPASRLLGEISFSVYLLHGLLLFWLFRMIVPTPVELSPFQHWLVIFGATPLLFLVCLTTFAWVESPGIKHAPLLTDWLKERARFMGRKSG